MREIKFRAWSGTAFLNPSEFCIFGDGSLYSLNQEINLGCGRSHINNLSAKIMQYTGLKDKNGVEIYQGDIMKAKRHNFEDYDICVIVYRPISFVFEVQSEKGNYIAPRNWHQHFEVIGNIYENQELLK